MARVDYIAWHSRLFTSVTISLETWVTFTPVRFIHGVVGTSGQFMAIIAYVARGIGIWRTSAFASSTTEAWQTLAFVSLARRIIQTLSVFVAVFSCVAFVYWIACLAVSFETLQIGKENSKQLSVYTSYYHKYTFFEHHRIKPALQLLQKYTNILLQMRNMLADLIARTLSTITH